MRKNAADALVAFVASVDDIDARLAVLEALLAGVERVVAPDGTVGLYFPMRLGVQSRWWLTQPAGSGVGMAVTTAVDPIALYVQHDGVNSPQLTQRTALHVLNTDSNPDGVNKAIVAVATNAPHGNVAVDANAQYAPAAAVKVTVETVSEVDASGTPLHTLTIDGGGAHVTL